jgi:hypothetical protein
VLFLADERNVWSRHLVVAAGLAVVAVVPLCVWAVIELRSTTPLVDVRAVRHPAVAGANLAMFVGGIGMYLLLTLITRYAQTPHGAGYGFGLTTFVAGLVLIPFSVLGFVAGNLTPRVRTRIADPLLLAGSAVVGSPCSRRPGRTWPNCSRRWACSASASAASRPPCRRHPGCHIQKRDVERHELQLRRPQRRVLPGQRHRRPDPRPGHLFPDDSAYTTAALVGTGAMAITTLTSLALARRRSYETNP